MVPGGAGRRGSLYLLARCVSQRIVAANEEAATAGREGRTALVSVADRNVLGNAVDALRVCSAVRRRAGVAKVEAARERRAKAAELRTRSITLHDEAHGYRQRGERDFRATERYSI